MLPEVDLEGLPQHRLNAEFLDTFYLHRAAIDAGYETILFPGQVLVLRAKKSNSAERGGHSDIVFVEGVPPSSTLSGVSYTQERRVRRALLQRRGIPVPRGATF